MIEKSIHFKTTKIRDSLIKILMLCNEFSVTDLVKDIEDMQCLIQTYNPLLGKVFEEKYFVTNRFCKNIENLEMQV